MSLIFIGFKEKRNLELRKLILWKPVSLSLWLSSDNSLQVTKAKQYAILLHHCLFLFFETENLYSNLCIVALNTLSHLCYVNSNIESHTCERLNWINFKYALIINSLEYPMKGKL